MNKLEKINAFLQTRGYDLRKIKGQKLNNANIICKALTEHEAIETIKLYYQLKVPILGGDVFYLNTKGEINWTYDNWYIERSTKESDVDFLEKSISETEIFIKNYQNNAYQNCIFLFDIVYEKHYLNCE